MADAAATGAGPEVGDSIEVAIHELGYGGVGVGRHASGLVCLVPRTLPGEVVVAEVVRRQRRLLRGRVQRIVQPSPERASAPCAHFAACGGCHLQHLGYDAQLTSKQAVLARNLARALGEDVTKRIAAVVPSPSPLGYRNRSFYHVAGGQLGFIDPLAETLVNVEHCLVSEPAAEAVTDRLRAWLRGAGAELAPLVLDAMVRTGREGAMCVLVVASEDLSAAAVQRWHAGEPVPRLQPLRTLATALAPASLWLSPKPRRSMAMLGQDILHLAGPERIVEAIGPFTLELSPASFVQANPAVAAQLYARVVDVLAPAAADHVLDLYCGSGALAFHLARKAAQVYAVDLNHLALADARASAARNGIANVAWRAGKCEAIATKLARGGDRFRVASINPPRTGLHAELPALLARLGVERVAYVSCSPPTLARDLARLGTFGFTVAQIVPFDMFPQTYHLETLTLLER